MNERYKRVRFQRSFLVRMVQEYEVDLPAACDVEAWLESDMAGLDDYICNNADLESEDRDPIDDDQLEVHVIRHLGPVSTS